MHIISCSPSSCLLLRRINIALLLGISIDTMIVIHAGTAVENSIIIGKLAKRTDTQPLHLLICASYKPKIRWDDYIKVTKYNSNYYV